MLRLAPRDDPLPELYELYAEVRVRLPEPANLAWTLRRFERDFLEILGFGFDLQHDADGAPIDPAARYLLDPMEGPRRVLSEREQQNRRGTATGRALLALAFDEQPVTEDMPGLRLSMRAVLAHHLGGRGLKSWEMLEDLGRRRG
jgi:DNA repair protein RecO (recombination protein O)